MATERAEVEAIYNRYLQRCNEHRFDELDEFVDEHVEVNGVVQGLHGYAEGLGAVVEAGPDYHWDLRPAGRGRLAERAFDRHGHDLGRPADKHSGVRDVPGGRRPDRGRPRPSTDLCHSQAELVWQALREGWGLATFSGALADYAARRQSEV